MSYATPTDFGAWNGTLVQPSDIQRLLDRASDLLDAALITAVYAIDANSNPTDAVIVAALKNACCAQVEWWIVTDVEFGMVSRQQLVNMGAVGAWENAAAGDLSRTAPWSPAQGVPTGRARLAPRAREILLVARLWNVRPLAL